MIDLVVYSIKPFKGDSGLSLSVVSDRNAKGERELSSVVSSLEQFYIQQTNDLDTSIPRTPKRVEQGGLLYRVLDGSNDYVGSVKVVPKGNFSRKPKVDRREDYAVADRTTYGETYFIFFYPKDKTKRAEHRDGFIFELDPRGEKTKRE